uniref:Transposase (Putative), gypsy type n=1 Tax=Tanacetum cinerariifolium TaxID=118510 RepID=A0A6L2K9T9_TANCI|nr:hypothetical protein [Tanacetum cinerariifolium]
MGKKRLEGRCGMQANLLKERDAEIVDLKARLSLREAEAAETIRLRGQVANVKAAEAALAGELESLKERNVALEGRVTTLVSATVSKDSEASSLECEKGKLVDQDEQVKALSDRAASIDSDLMDMALHMEEEFYPCYLTTIARRRWILGHGLKLAVIKCLQSPEYLFALGGGLGRAIDKGMQDGLAAGVDHRRVRRSLDDIAAYDPSAYAPSCLTGNPEASQLQPSPEQLMVPIHRLEDQLIIEDTSLSFSLDVAHVRTQRIKVHIAARRLSLTDAMVPLLEPLSAKSLTGEASTFGFLVMTTALLTTFVQANTVPPTPSPEVPPSPKIVFEQDGLDTTPEHASAP